MDCDAHSSIALPNDSSKQETVCAMVVCGVVVAPKLRPGEREVPELINETAHSLLLSQEPLVITISCLHNTQISLVTNQCRESVVNVHVLTTKSFGL